MKRHEIRATIAAILAFTNSGGAITGPRRDHTVLRNLTILKKRPYQNASAAIDFLCSHVMENGVLQACFEEEARGWAATIRRMKDAEIERTWPDVWNLVSEPLPPAGTYTVERRPW